MIPLALASPLVSIVASTAAVALIVGGVYLKGRQDGREAMLASQLRAASQVVKRQKQQTEKVRVQFVERVKVVRERGEDVIREVEKLIPADACRLDGGFRVLHDAAAAGALPDAASGTHGPPAPVEQAAAARAVAENYFTCHENAEQLIALQQWARAQQKLNKGE